MSGTTDGGDDRLAPVVPLFGARGSAHRSGGSRPAEPIWHAGWLDEGAVGDQPGDVAFGGAASGGDPAGGYDGPGANGRELAEQTLLKRLRRRSLSVREARAVVSEYGLDGAQAERLLDDFVRLGYLDDTRLAEQLVHSGTERKAQGRQAIGRSLAARGIPREVIDAALSELPDDDDERALAFARQRARSLASLERDTALRRLHGQLARRGFAGSTALSAARQALDEASGHARGGRAAVRFD